MSLSQENDRMEMLKAFDEAKTGVKGLIDSGLATKIPKIFVRPSEELAQDQLTYKEPQIQVPVIDLSCIFQANNADRRKQIVGQVRIASESCGFFQVVNHEIPSTVLDEMIDGIKRFNEQDVEEKKRYYTRDMARSVRFRSNFDLFFSRTANWRDSLLLTFPDQICPRELPPCCRDSTMDYSKHASVLGRTLLELFSEALGLKPDTLYNMKCIKGHRYSYHYYPACPEPELTLGSTEHTDPSFITILLQNHLSGLQVLYHDQWIDVQPIPGAVVINIGDLLQLVSNGKFKSSIHRVMAKSTGPRISVACFVSGPYKEAKIYGPIKQLISEENPAKYREVVLCEYIIQFLHTGLDQKRLLDDYKL